MDRTEHTVRIADNKLLHRKLASKLVEFQRSQTKDMAPKKHKLRGTGGKYVSASDRAQLMERIISESKSKVRKVESDEEDSDSDYYDNSDGKPVHVNIDKELAVDKPTLALLRNRSEEDEIHKNGETGDNDGKIRLRRSKRIFKPPERLGTVPFF